ncbi:MAG: acyltransferase [Treponemataceae bacterium]|nr:acyltransferase [Treponemataceae bacterium]
MIKIIKRLLSILYAFFVKRKVLEYGENLHVNKYSKVSPKTKLGSNVNFNGIKIYGCGEVVIGNNFHSGNQCLIISEIHNYDNGSAVPYDSSYIEKPILIEDNVWIGDRVIILGGSIIREGSIIQAGSVVVGEIPYCAIAGGHPAKVFKYRDKDHYESLNNKGQTH